MVNSILSKVASMSSKELDDYILKMQDKVRQPVDVLPPPELIEQYKPTVLPDYAQIIMDMEARFEEKLALITINAPAGIDGKDGASGKDGKDGQ